MWVSKQHERIRSLDERLQLLAVEVEKLKSHEAARDREMRSLVTEWKSTFEKFNTLWARLQRRVNPKPQNAPETTNGDQLDLNPLAIRLLSGGK